MQEQQKHIERVLGESHASLQEMSMMAVKDAVAAQEAAEKEGATAS